MKAKMDVNILLEQKTKNNHAPNSNDCASARDLFQEEASLYKHGGFGVARRLHFENRIFDK